MAVARHRWLSNPDVSHDAKSLKEDRLPTERELWLRVEHALMNAALRFCWADAPLDPGEPQRSLREGARMLISEGVELIKRRGAGLCLECGRPVSGGDRSRAARIVYCAPCSGSLDDSRKRRHRDVLSATLGRIAEAMGTSDRTARRRVRRAGQ